jgi:hypothetical protein
VLFRFPAGCQPPVAAVKPLLGAPRVRNNVRGRPALATVQRLPHEGVMPVVPGGFDENAPQMRVAGLGYRPAGLGRPTGVLRWYQSDKGHQAGGGRKARRVAQFGGDRQGREIVDASKAAETAGPGPQRLEVEQGPQVLLDGAQPRHDFIDGPQLRLMGLRERGEGPRLRPYPDVVPLGPRARRREPAAVPQQEFREPVPGAE